MVDAERNKLARRLIVELLNDRHAERKQLPDLQMMWHMLTDMACDVGENDVIVLLKDLLDRGYITYEEKKDRPTLRIPLLRGTRRVDIREIQLTPKGRDLLEGTISDPAFVAF